MTAPEQCARYTGLATELFLEPFTTTLVYKDMNNAAATHTVLTRNDRSGDFQIVAALDGYRVKNLKTGYSTRSYTLARCRRILKGLSQ